MNKESTLRKASDENVGSGPKSHRYRISRGKQSSIRQFSDNSLDFTYNSEKRALIRKKAKNAKNGTPTGGGTLSGDQDETNILLNHDTIELHPDMYDS